MSVPNEYRQLEAEISELEQAIEAGTRQAKRTSRVSLGIGITLIAVILVFLASNYFHIRTAFTKERFRDSLTREVASLSPTAMQEVQQLGQVLLPIYAAELRKQVEASWPEISGKLEREVSELSNNLLDLAHQTLAGTEQRVLAEAETALEGAYPGLKDPVEQEKLRQRVEVACKAAIGDSIASFESRYRKDVTRLQECLFQFDVTDSHESPTDLQKKFISLWLQLLNQEVIEL